MPIVLATLFIIICVLLILVVLLQKGRGGGLGAALGGGAGSAFGTRTGDVFTWVTIVLTGLFLLLAIGTTLTFRPEKTRVSAPFFRPEPRLITREIRVTILVRGDKGNTKIYYTADGTTPSDKSKPYMKIPVKVQPPLTVLKAIAYRPGWLPSPVTVGRYGPPEELDANMPAPAPAPATEPATAPSATAPATSTTAPGI
jgi:preprotein translocase subunit SecG